MKAFSHFGAARGLRMVAAAALLLLTAPSAQAVYPTPAQQKGKMMFRWGVDVGASIDMSTQDMSTLDADAYFGLSTPSIAVLGVGAGIHAMVNNSSFTYPVYAILRTSFSSRPQLVYFELRGGVAINSVYAVDNKTSLYLAPSIGVRLATGPTWRSYLSIGYAYNGLKHEEIPGVCSRLHHIDMAVMKLGIAF